MLCSVHLAGSCQLLSWACVLNRDNGYIPCHAADGGHGQGECDMSGIGEHACKTLISSVLYNSHWKEVFAVDQ